VPRNRDRALWARAAVAVAPINRIKTATSGRRLMTPV